MTPSTRLKASEETNSSNGLPSSPAFDTPLLAIVPKTLSGEKPPAVAPLMTISPINKTLIW